MFSRDLAELEETTKEYIDARSRCLRKEDTCDLEAFMNLTRIWYNFFCSGNNDIKGSVIFFIFSRQQVSNFYQTN